MYSNLLYTLLLTNSALALSPIVIKGSKFFNSKSKDQFFIKGLAYQPGGEAAGVDPLADIKICQRDLPYFQKLKINTLRVYQVDHSKDHDACMKLFDDNGIYVIVDLPQPGLSVDRANPQYTMDILDLFKKKIDTFSKYDNVLAFIGGNEVSNDIKTVQASVYVKSSIRDAKAHMKSKKDSRYIPIGYADNDDPAIQQNIMSYFDCGGENERADFYGINIYRWKGASSFTVSGYDRFIDESQGYDIPIFFSEFGAQNNGGRPFTEVQSIFGSEMTDVLSGGIAYEYTMEPNKFGIVKVVSESKVNEISPDFENLASMYGEVSPSGVNMDSYTPSGKPRECPEVDDKWEVSPVLPFTPSEKGCECALKKLSCVAKANTGSRGVEIGKKMSDLCEKGYCVTVKADAKEGKYTPFATCSNHIKQSLIYNQAAIETKTCDFDGLAEKGPGNNEDISECEKIIKADSVKGGGASKGGEGESSFAMNLVQPSGLALIAALALHLH